MRISNYEHGDELAILELFKASFKKELSLEYWKWRFLNNPVQKTMIKLMWDETVLAGHYAVCPVETVIEGNVKLTSLSMTTMTHPDYAGRGIFSTLAEDLYKTIADNYGVATVWGFPNTNSHYGFIKNLQWKDLSVIPTLSLKTAALKTKSNDGVTVVRDFCQEHVQAFQSLTKNFTVVTNRSVAYLKWRYIDNPSVRYEIFEYNANNFKYFAVAKVFKSFADPAYHEVDIVDLFFPADVSALSSLLHAITEHYKEYKLLKINTWLPLKDSRHLALEKLGFSYDLPLTYLGVRTFSDDVKTATDNFNNWYFAMGDSDVF